MSNWVAEEHRDWHTVANAEGVNAWDCPWDCMDLGEDEGPALYATVWYHVPGSKTDDERGYPVFSRGQMHRFATVAAARSGKAVRIELAR